MCSFSSVISLRSTIGSRWRHNSYYFLDNPNVFVYNSLNLVANRLLDKKNFRKMGLYFSNFVFSDTPNSYFINIFDFEYGETGFSEHAFNKGPFARSGKAAEAGDKLISTTHSRDKFKKGRVALSKLKSSSVTNARAKFKATTRGKGYREVKDRVNFGVAFDRFKGKILVFTSKNFKPGYFRLRDKVRLPKFFRNSKILRRSLVRLKSREFIFFTAFYFYDRKRLYLNFCFDLTYLFVRDFFISSKFWKTLKIGVGRFKGSSINAQHSIVSKKPKGFKSGTEFEYFVASEPRRFREVDSTFSKFRFTHLSIQSSQLGSVTRILNNSIHRLSSKRCDRVSKGTFISYYTKFYKFLLFLGANSSSRFFFRRLSEAFVSLFKFMFTYLFRFRFFKFSSAIEHYVSSGSRVFSIFRLLSLGSFPHRFFKYSNKVIQRWVHSTYVFRKIRRPIYFMFKTSFDFSQLQIFGSASTSSGVNEVGKFASISPYVLSSMFKHRLILGERLNPSFFSVVNFVSRRSKVLGITFSRSGRFIKWPRAVFDTFRLGRVSFNSYLLPVDFSFDTLIMKYSKVSFKVWLSYAPPINFLIFSSELSSLVFPSAISDMNFKRTFRLIENRQGIKDVRYYSPSLPAVRFGLGSPLDPVTRSSKVSFVPAWDYKYFRAYRRFSKFFRNVIIRELCANNVYFGT